MKRHDLFRRLILRAPPDLVAAIYQRCRPLEASGAIPSWEEIVRAAQGIGIFTTEEASAFLHLVVDRLGDATQTATTVQARRVERLVV
jgi:hypothetical protein